MIVGIDGNEANVDKRVGVSVYTLELLKYFSSVDENNLFFRVYLREKPKASMPKESSNFTYVVVPGKYLWSQLFLPLHLRFSSKVDVFFSPAHYSPRFLQSPLVVTIHDLAYAYYPNEYLKKDLYKLKNWTKYSVLKATKIISVSKTTKKDLIYKYGVDDMKIQVIYNGYTKHDLPKNSGELLKVKFGIDKKKYILHIGTLQPRKNIITLIKAFANFYQHNPDFKLVLGGKKGWLYQEIYHTVSSLNLEKAIIFTDFVTDEIESSLYENAFCLVLPSLYEGFGLPILEAMSHHIPVIASQSASLPEVGGDACLYFEPKNIEDLEEKLIKLQTDRSLYNQLVAKGKKRVKEFSWQKCASETLSLIKSVTHQ